MKEDTMHHHHEMTNEAPIPEADKAICPVLNIPTSKSEAKKDGLTRTRAGQTYFLCCSTCATDFDKNPAQYAKTA